MAIAGPSYGGRMSLKSSGGEYGGDGEGGNELHSCNFLWLKEFLFNAKLTPFWIRLLLSNFREIHPQVDGFHTWGVKKIGIRS
jgi:hypothetical protein